MFHVTSFHVAVTYTQSTLHCHFINRKKLYRLNYILHNTSDKCKYKKENYIFIIYWFLI